MNATANYIPTKPLSVQEVKQWDFETDVLISGFGGAGGCAAIEAANHKAEVMLLEMASGSGGTTALSSAELYLGGNGGTRVQRKAGFNDDTEDMFRYLMLASGPNADEAKVRYYAENNLKHFQWLQDLGVPFSDEFSPEKMIVFLTENCLLYTGNEEAYPFCDVAKPCPRGHKPKILGDNGGQLLIDVLTKEVNSKPNIKVNYDSRVLTTIINERRRVCGVVARMNNKPIYIKARRGVILCSGGFVMNSEMLKRYAPNLLRPSDPIGSPGDDGSGILMGMGAGGAAINMGEGFVTIPYYPPSSLVKGVLVNEQGQRFINEDCYHGRVGYFALQQPGNSIFLIADNTIFGRPDENMRIQLRAVGETIEELEKELKLPEKTLQNTVNTFNHFASQGKDPLFHKQSKFLRPLTDPPFAALDCSIGEAYYPFFTLGGLDTLVTGEVLTANQEVVEGLYAAGRNACGVPRYGGGYSSGMSVGDATLFGRLAGKTAANAVAIN